ncbi:MAG: porin family protein [Chitinophagaceae bacterium]
MKKFILPLSMMLALGLGVHAQVFRGNTVTERTKFGIQAGMSIPYESYGNSDYYGSSSDAFVGFTGGINVEIPIRNGWYIQPEANFSMMGGKDWGSDDDGSYRFKDALNYLHVPLLIKYKPMLQGFGVYFGPQYGYLLSARQHYYDGVASADIKETAVKNEFSLVFGIEYYFPSANDGPSFGIGLRGMAALTSNLDQDKYSYAVPSIRNNAAFLTVGMRF